MTQVEIAAISRCNENKKRIVKISILNYSCWKLPIFQLKMRITVTLSSYEKCWFGPIWRIWGKLLTRNIMNSTGGENSEKWDSQMMNQRGKRECWFEYKSAEENVLFILNVIYITALHPLWKKAYTFWKITKGQYALIFHNFWLQRTMCFKGQKWSPLELVYLFIFCGLPHADNKLKT